MALIVLKIGVSTLRGICEDVPNPVRMLREHEAGTTFPFSLGPDYTGRALRRAFCPGSLEKASRTSVVEHYGFRTLMYGMLLPGPDIGCKAAAEMHAIGEVGSETSIHTQGHALWQDNMRQRSADWIARQMIAAHARSIQIFGKPPVTHGAADWQMNGHAFRQIDNWGMAYAFDGWGTYPHIPSIDSKVLNHAQLPTTLPTLDELTGVEDITLDNIARHVLKVTESDRDQIFTLYAELEGQKLASILRELLRGWRAQGHRPGPMGDYYATLDRSALPAQPVMWGEVAGYNGSLIVQPT